MLRTIQEKRLLRNALISSWFQQADITKGSRLHEPAVMYGSIENPDNITSSGEGIKQVDKSSVLPGELKLITS